MHHDRREQGNRCGNVNGTPGIHQPAHALQALELCGNFATLTQQSQQVTRAPLTLLPTPTSGGKALNELCRGSSCRDKLLCQLRIHTVQLSLLGDDPALVVPIQDEGFFDGEVALRLGEPTRREGEWQFDLSRLED